jgi:hypothetical protein
LIFESNMILLISFYRRRTRAPNIAQNQIAKRRESDFFCEKLRREVKRK